VLSLTRNKFKPWTGQEQMKLRKLYRTGDRSELIEALPGRTFRAIEHRARALRVCRAKKPYKATKDPLLDELRAECFRQGITMPDLDVIADAKGYFHRIAWRGPHGCIDMRRIVKAIRELGGEIRVEWPDV
jgi:hypothetical protein